MGRRAGKWSCVLPVWRTACSARSSSRKTAPPPRCETSREGLTDRVYYHDNDVKLDSQALPVPDPN